MIAVIPEEAPMAHARSVRSGGEIIVDYLVREKVPYVFGLCAPAAPIRAVPVMTTVGRRPAVLAVQQIPRRAPHGSPRCPLER
jgi:hypothetical protein